MRRSRMRLLLHGNLAPAVADALRAREDTVRTVADVGLAPGASPDDIIKAAQKDQAEILTTDPAVATALFDRDEPPPKFNRSIVYFQLEGADVEQDDAVARLFERYKRLTPGRLYTVTASRVKVRQLPST